MKPINWTMLQPGEMCMFHCGDSRDGLVEILRVNHDIPEVEFQKLNGKDYHHGHVAVTEYISCFYEID